jgi:hypothetical protein
VTGKDILKCMIHRYVHSMQFNMDGWYKHIVGNNGLGDGLQHYGVEIEMVGSLPMVMS